MIGTGPYDSLRDYMEAIETHGNVIRIEAIDQDAYELTGFMYKLIDKHGWLGAPSVIVESVKISGEWIQGPIVINQYGMAAHEAMAIGVPLDDIEAGHHVQNYKKALKKMMDIGELSPIETKTIDQAAAPSKEVILKENEINILDFAFIQTNPGDNGRFINTGNLVTIDPEAGRNVGTYRMQIKGPRKIGISPEKGQDGWKFLMNMKEKGEDVAQAAVVLGTDPIVFAMSSSKTARSGQDELEIAGGFKGKPVEVVKCENSDILVPANVEMIIEGEIPLNDLEKEGPFGEMYGYMGLPHEEQFYMNIKTITHRVNPMIVNQFTGVTRGYITTPGEAASLRGFSKFMPELRGFHIPIDHVGFLFLSIEKTKPHQAIELAEKFNFLPLGKIVIVVDEDVDIHNTKEVFQTVGARWQPYPGAKLIEDGPGFFLDPSAKTRGKSSRILIDATRQLPEENGPSPYPKLNKEHLIEHAPEIFALVEEKWGHLI
ncbi:MAG TPA: UbiD family decarboxylase [Gammaproteobacteria bacterium]|jgi:4-hydroxy-3-polyprenylbenzoate decarboxylase|nr:UbiD family decarboxylase [Gammaproteobacteria bacterium]